MMEFRPLERTDWRFHPTKNAVIVNQDKIPIQQAKVTLEAEASSIKVETGAWGEGTIIGGSIKGLTSQSSGLLTTEIPFIDGYTEFLRLSDPRGFFSVDYERDTIRLPSAYPLSQGEVIQFEACFCSMEYGIGLPLVEGDAYTKTEMGIELKPRYMNKLFEQNRSSPGYDKLLIRYDGNGQNLLNGATIEPYYTPVIRDLAIVGISQDPRLSTLESL